MIFFSRVTKILLAKNSIIMRFFRSLCKFIFLILPIVILFKTLYICWYENVFNFEFFSVHYISHIPFFGKMFLHCIWDDTYLSKYIIDGYQYIMEIMSVGAIGRNVAIFLLDLFELNSLKVPVTGVNISHPSEEKGLSTKSFLTLFKGSDGESDSPKGAAGSSSSPKGDGSSKDSAESLSKSKNKSKDLDMSSISEEVDKSVVISILADEVAADTKKMCGSLSAWAKQLEIWIDFPCPDNKLTPKLEEAFLTMLRDQSKIFSINSQTRMIWADARAANVLPETQTKLKEINSKLVELQTKYYSKVKLIASSDNKTYQVKEFYSCLNEYRNLVNKELNKVDNLIIGDLKGSALYKFPQIRNAVNIEYVQAKKYFNDTDSYLKKRIGEILNNKTK